VWATLERRLALDVASGILERSSSAPPLCELRSGNDEPMKRFSLLLPALQVPLAIALWEMGRFAQVPRRLDTLYSPTSTMVSFGINAPAVFFRALVFPLTRGNLWRPPDFLGFELEQLAFFVGVGILWYVVGRVLDRRRSNKLRIPRRITAGELVLNLLFVLLGLAILLEGIQGFRNPGRWNNRLGNYMEGTLFVAWSLVLIGIPVLRLAKRKHGGRSSVVTPIE